MNVPGSSRIRRLAELPGIMLWRNDRIQRGYDPVYGEIQQNRANAQARELGRVSRKGAVLMYTKKVEPIYTEQQDAGNRCREEYKQGIVSLIERRKTALLAERERFGQTLMAQPEAGRKALRDMLGWPLTEPPQPLKKASEEVLTADAEAIVSRVQLEVMPGLKFYGILMRHNTDEKLPLVIAQHGGAGTPELCSSFFDSTNYNDMSVRIFRKGVNVFAPQLLLWHEGPFGADSQRMEMENDLRRLGSSIAAIEIDCLSRAMDYLEKKPWFSGRFGMIGLSYGSFYTLYTAACETRIRAALACSMFSDRQVCFGTDFSWKDSFARFGDAEVGALVYPRALRIEWGAADPGKWGVGAQAEYERLERYYAAQRGQLSYRVFEGGHEFCPEDDGIDWVIQRLNQDG